MAACAERCKDSPTSITDDVVSASIVLRSTVPSLSITQGFAVDTGVQIERRGGYRGSLSASVEGQFPNGVFAQGSGTSEPPSTYVPFFVATGPSTPPGSYPLVVRIRGAGIADVTMALQLTVLSAPPSPSFTLDASPTNVTVAVGATAATNVTAVRTNFTTDVGLSVLGLPTGVSWSLGNVVRSGNTSTGTITFAASSNAVPGQYQVTLRGSVPGLVDRNVTLTLTVTGGNPGPTRLVPVSQPTAGESGVALIFPAVIEVRNAANAVVPGATNVVTATLASGSGTLLGTTSVAAVNGVATFSNLIIAGSGPHTIEYNSAGLAGSGSSVITVTQTVRQLVVVASPTGAVSNVPFATQPVIQLRDAAGLPMSSATNAVTATLSSGGGTLGGTSTRNAVGGTVTFTDLRIVGTGVHTLNFATPGATSATTAGFSVSGGTAGIGLTVGNSAALTATAGNAVSIPVSLDFSNAPGGANVASIQFALSWDAARFEFVSGSINGSAGMTLQSNESSAVSGSVLVAGFATTGVTSTRALYTLTLRPRSAAVGTTSVIGATVSAAGNELGASVTITPRNLNVSVVP